MSTAPRTDIHRPANPDFDPLAYEFRGVFDLGITGDAARGSMTQRGLFNQAVAALRAEGFTPASDDDGIRCGHCGQQGLRYVAIMALDKGGVREWIYVGETCLDHRFSLAQGEFHALRKAAELDRQAQKVLAAFTAACDADSALAYATYAQNMGAAIVGEVGGEPVTFAELHRKDRVLDIMADVARKARNHGGATEGQMAMINKHLGWLADADAATAEKLAEARARAEAEANIPPLAEGRQQMIGEVVSAKWVDNDFGGALKILVRLEGGQRVYGTCPRALDAANGSVTGRRVTFTAAVQVSDDDPTFGFYSRPTKVSAA